MGGSELSSGRSFWPLGVYLQEARKGGAPLGSRDGAGVAVLALGYGATLDTGRRRGPVAEAQWALWPRVNAIISHFHSEIEGDQPRSCQLGTIKSHACIETLGTHDISSIRAHERKTLGVATQHLELGAIVHGWLLKCSRSGGPVRSAEIE